LDRQARVFATVRASFKPEFVNRLDAMVVFDPLTTDDLGRIVDIQVARLAGRLADRRLRLEVSSGARDWLAIAGYDPAYGARPLRRLVQSAIGDQLARKLLGGEVRDGNTVVVDVDMDRDALTVGTAGIVDTAPRPGE
jgi:ATP-dependent Clp protease ATP-binding subunit ClpB